MGWVTQITYCGSQVSKNTIHVDVQMWTVGKRFVWRGSIALRALPSILLGSLCLRLLPDCVDVMLVT
jgi:hypothetical protein